MFAVTGAGIIDPDVEIKEFPLDNAASVLISLRLIGKDPYKPIRHYYNCTVIVPLKSIEVARQALQPNKYLQVRLGELKGKKTEKGFIFNDIQTKWQWIEILTVVPNKERKKDI